MEEVSCLEKRWDKKTAENFNERAKEEIEMRKSCGIVSEEVKYMKVSHWLLVHIWRPWKVKNEVVAMLETHYGSCGEPQGDGWWGRAYSIRGFLSGFRFLWKGKAVFFYMVKYHFSEKFAAPLSVRDEVLEGKWVTYHHSKRFYQMGNNQLLPDGESPEEWTGWRTREPEGGEDEVRQGYPVSRTCE